MNSSKQVTWEKPSLEESEKGFCLKLVFTKTISSVVWHRKGDYFATVSPEAQSSAVQIHQLSKGSSQNPFSKSLGMVQKVVFHPSRPILFVAVSL